MTFERLLPRVRAVPPITADLLVAAGVALFTAYDAAVNDPEYRQADAFTWLLVAVSVLALVARRRRPVPVVVVTGAACAGWALYGHIGELLNLPVIVALYTVAVLGDRRRTVWTGAVAAVVSGAVTTVIGLLLLPSLFGPLFGGARRWIAGLSPTAALEKLTQTSDATAETVGGLGPWPSLWLVAGCTAALLLVAVGALRRRDV